MTKQEPPRISDAEWRVMRVLWMTNPQTANQVVEALTGETDWKPKTIRTLLTRLVQKGALGVAKEGREFLYTPQAGEAECVHAEGRSFLERVYGGAVRPMLAHFLEEEELTPEEIEELKNLLERKRRY